MVHSDINGKRSKVMVSGSRSVNRAYCPSCEVHVQLLTPRETGERFKANWAEFSRLVAKGAIHRIHNSKGEIRVCSSSLERTTDDRGKKFLFLAPIQV
jgi:hypothetical protein